MFKYATLIIGFLAIGALYFYLQNQPTANEVNVAKNTVAAVSTNIEYKDMKTPDSITYEDTININAVATIEGNGIEYFNWNPLSPCENTGNCFLGSMMARVTFLNSGDASVAAEEGDAFIQIANRGDSNCEDPSQAHFSRYLASSPILNGGTSVTDYMCGESSSSNTCVLTVDDGFIGSADCFSLKLSSKSINEGEINFATVLLSIKYTWQWATDEHL